MAPIVGPSSCLRWYGLGSLAGDVTQVPFQAAACCRSPGESPPLRQRNPSREPGRPTDVQNYGVSGIWRSGAVDDPQGVEILQLARWGAANPVVGLQLQYPIETHVLCGLLHDFSQDGLGWGLPGLDPASRQGPQTGHGRLLGALGAQHAPAGANHGACRDSLVGVDGLTRVSIGGEVRHPTADERYLRVPVPFGDVHGDADVVVDELGRQVVTDDVPLRPQNLVWIDAVTDREGMDHPATWHSHGGDDHLSIQPLHSRWWRRGEGHVTSLVMSRPCRSCTVWASPVSTVMVGSDVP